MYWCPDKRDLEIVELQDKLLLYTTHSKKSVKTHTLIYKKMASSQTTLHPGIPSGLDVKNSDNVYKCKVCGLVFKNFKNMTRRTHSAFGSAQSAMEQFKRLRTIHARRDIFMYLHII